MKSLNLKPLILEDYEEYISIDALKAITDGIFAVAMTMLALTIHLPETGELTSIASLHTYLGSFTFEVLLYFMSFLILGSIWISERRLLHHIEETDKNFMWLTLLFLMFIVLVPVTYPLINSYGTKFPIFTYMFHCNMLILGTFVVTQWAYANKRDWQHKNHGKKEGLRVWFKANRERDVFSKKIRSLIFFPVVALLALIISFWYPTMSNLCYLLLIMKTPILNYINKIEIIKNNTQTIQQIENIIKTFINYKTENDSITSDNITKNIADNDNIIKNKDINPIVPKNEIIKTISDNPKQMNHVKNITNLLKFVNDNPEFINYIKDSHIISNLFKNNPELLYKIKNKMTVDKIIDLYPEINDKIKEDNINYCEFKPNVLNNTNINQEYIEYIHKLKILYCFFKKNQ